MPTNEILVLLATGLFAGLAGGLVGIGGSVIMIPAMTLLLATGQHVAQGAAMIVTSFVAAPAAWQHLRHKALQRSVVSITVPAAAIGSLAGVWLSERHFFEGSNQIRLSRLFGAFLVGLACFAFWRVVRPPIEKPTGADIKDKRHGILTALIVGLPTGMAGGLLGVGGGIVCTALQQVTLRTPLRNAIANSSATIICVSLVGATAKNIYLVSDGVPFWTMGILAAVLIPTAFVGGLIGGKLTHVLPRGIVRAVLGIVMLAAGYKLLTRPPKGAGELDVPATQAVSLVDLESSSRLTSVGVRVEPCAAVR